VYLKLALERSIILFSCRIEDEFADEPEDEYDIISNPPFYSEDYKTENSKEIVEIFQDVLPFEDLVVVTFIIRKWNFCCNNSVQRRRTIYRFMPM
jgi:tRNA1(Val) A37 N6-methylase TrmN6